MELLCLLTELFIVAIVLRMVLSWFPLQPGGVAAQANGALRKVTDPLLEPLRRVLPPMGGLDLSPFVALILVQVVIRQIILGC
jgi:YggT family protein